MKRNLYTIVERGSAGQCRPILYKRTSDGGWKSCIDTVKSIKIPLTICTTPEEAIGHYLALQRTSLERQSDELTSTHYQKPLVNKHSVHMCPLGGRCVHIGWCDECPRFIGDDEEEDDE